MDTLDTHVCTLASPDALRLFTVLQLQHYPRPVCIDLDFTLLHSSSLYFFFPQVLKGIGRFLRDYPWRWTWFKSWAARTYPVNAKALPYRTFLVDFLCLCKSHDIPLVLATGAASETAHAVAQHLDCFDEVISSTETLHCVGHRKAQALVARFGHKNFYYFGDSRQDIAVWQQSYGVVALNPSLSLKQRLQELSVGKPHFFLYDT